MNSLKLQKQREQAMADMQLLSHLWPRVFILDSTRAKQVYPLKIGIHQASYPILKARGVNGVRLRRALRRYCNRLAYQYSLAKKRSRIKLRGRIVGVVTDDHQRQAKAKLDKILSKHRETL